MMRFAGACGLILILLAAILSLGSCANSGDNVTSAAATGAASASLASDAATNAVAADYRIAPQDTLAISVFQVQDLSRNVVVDEAGYITFPLIKRIKVGGMTTDQAQQAIAAKLGEKYLQSPQVSVLVAKSGQRITVSGAVAHPTVLAVAGRLTLSQAIAQAGGLSDVANSNRIHVARVAGEHVKDALYDLDAVHAGKVPDPSLHGGDIVVAESSNSKVVFKNIKDVLPFTALFTLLH